MAVLRVKHAIEIQKKYGHEIPLFRLTMKAVASWDWLLRYQGLGFVPLPVASHGTVSRSFRK